MHDADRVVVELLRRDGEDRAALRHLDRPVEVEQRGDRRRRDDAVADRLEELEARIIGADRAATERVLPVTVRERSLTPAPPAGRRSPGRGPSATASPPATAP